MTPLLGITTHLLGAASRPSGTEAHLSGIEDPFLGGRRPSFWRMRHPVDVHVIRSHASHIALRHAHVYAFGVRREAGFHASPLGYYEGGLSWAVFTLETRRVSQWPWEIWAD